MDTTWTQEDEARYQAEAERIEAENLKGDAWAKVLQDIGITNAEAALENADGLDDPYGSFADNCGDSVCELGSNEPWDCSWPMTEQQDIAYKAFMKRFNEGS